MNYGNKILIIVLVLVSFLTVGCESNKDFTYSLYDGYTIKSIDKEIKLYKDLDLVNKMLNYYEDEDINVYINTINVDRSFYNTLNNYEEVIKNSDSSLVFKPVNESILNLYLESIAI